MPQVYEIPLHLCQVLEEEFDNLHGDLSQKSVTLNGQVVVVEKDWLFHAGHVLSGQLADKLEKAQQRWLQDNAPEPAPTPEALNDEPDLATYLVFAYPPFLGQLRAARATPPSTDCIDTLNDILEDANNAVFKKARFKHLPLGDETRALLELGWSTEEMAFEELHPRPESSDQMRFKRLLLEDAFPEEIARVYDIRLARVFANVHGLTEGQTALCFSGGGIRSGTFALGVLQGLAEHDFLEKFDYLSTVSGGGYIGSWLTAWIHRHPEGLEGVIKDLRGATRTSKLKPEPEALRHLRDYSNFLTPQTGILSADTWTFITIYIRNLLLNWTAMIPLLLSVLMIPRVANAIVLADPDWRVAVGFLIVGTFLGGLAISYMRLNRPSNSGALRAGSFWTRRRNQGSFLRWCLVPLAISASFLTTYWAWYRYRVGANSPEPEFLGFVVFGTVLGLTGWFLYVLFAAASWRRERAKVRAALRDNKAKLAGNAFRELIITLLAGIVGAMLLYVAATKIGVFAEPVVDPFVTYADATRSNALRPYWEWWWTEWYTSFAFPVYLLVFFLGTTLFVGITSRRWGSEVHPQDRRVRYGEGPSRSRTDGSPRQGLDMLVIEDEDREWLARFSAWLFISLIAWSFFSVLVIFGPVLVYKFQQWLMAAGGLTGLLTILGGRSAMTPADPKQEAQQGWKGFLATNALVLAAFLFFVFLVIILSFLTSIIIQWIPTWLPDISNLTSQRWYADEGFPLFVKKLLEIPASSYDYFVNVPLADGPEALFRIAHFPPWFFLLSLAVAFQLIGRIAARLINLNKFSLHAGYRNRLIRAFLGASRISGERKENPFTGFDPRDNLSMHELRPGLLTESDFKSPEDLTAFVDQLKRATVGEAEPSTTSEYLRQQIRDIDGHSERYFMEPVGAHPSTSFKSALFADLNRILQTNELSSSALFNAPLTALHPDFKAMKALAELKKKTRGDYRILLNRLLLERAYQREIVPSHYPPPPYKLLHVVNMTLNLVGGDKLAWQQRKAETFTSTALHSGSFFVGYRRSRDYGGRDGISLGTAATISGAAASSNMGYFSASPFVTFVLTLFNARLGWWLGNPGIKGYDTYYQSHPKKALSPIIDEAFGLTNDKNPYVLLSDGGHFENLGLYEMVLRRCRTIVVVDGSSDPEGTYSDLGGAVRKIRIDFGIRIEFKPMFPIHARSEGKTSGGYCVVGDIHYEDVDDDLKNEAGDPIVRTGKLIYIKPAFYGDEPRDIFNYAKGNPTFPHESTADQFFDEPQFESHRMLGHYIIESLCQEGALKTPAGDVVAAAPCQGDLEQMVRWLEARADRERKA